MSDKKMQINGFTATTHSDEWIAIMSEPGAWRSATAVNQRVEPIKSAERQEIYQRAEQEGYTLVTVERHIYAAYDLRSLMKRRSGTLVKRIEARRNAAGVWFEVKSSSSSFY